MCSESIIVYVPTSVGASRMQASKYVMRIKVSYVLINWLSTVDHTSTLRACNATLNGKLAGDRDSTKRSALQLAPSGPSPAVPRAASSTASLGIVWRFGGYCGAAGPALMNKPEKLQLRVAVAARHVHRAVISRGIRRRLT